MLFASCAVLRVLCSVSLLVVPCRIVQPVMLPIPVYLPRHMHCDLLVIAGPEPAFALNAIGKAAYWSHRVPVCLLEIGFGEWWREDIGMMH